MAAILAFLFSSFMILRSNIVRELIETSQEKCKEIPERTCPACGPRHLIKNGLSHNDKSKNQSKSCGYQFVDKPTKTTVSLGTK